MLVDAGVTVILNGASVTTTDVVATIGPLILEDLTWNVTVSSFSTIKS